MIGSLVSFLYNENSPDNICVILRRYGDDIVQDEDKDLFLVYDLKDNEYFYAMIDELSFLYLQEEQ